MVDCLPSSTTSLLLSEALSLQLIARNWRVATAESCTGGGIAAAMTQVAGSSAWFEYGVISYANRAKQHLLHVQADTLAQSGAVSEAVVLQMVQGILVLSDADIAIAVSGIAGPLGGSAEKPVGTVWFAWALASGETRTQCCQFSGDRASILQQAIIKGFEGLLAFFE